MKMQPAICGDTEPGSEMHNADIFRCIFQLSSWPDWLQELSQVTCTLLASILHNGTLHTAYYTLHTTKRVHYTLHAIYSTPYTLLCVQFRDDGWKQNEQWHVTHWQTLAALPSNALYQHFTVLYCIVMHSINIAQYCNALWSTTLLYTEVHSNALKCTPMHWTVSTAFLLHPSCIL